MESMASTDSPDPKKIRFHAGPPLALGYESFRRQHRVDKAADLLPPSPARNISAGLKGAESVPELIWVWT
jgi:hypothetical protein